MNPSPRLDKCLLLLWLLIVPAFAQARQAEMSSPDGRYRYVLSDETGRLEYSLKWDGIQIIEKSVLGISSDDLWLKGLEIKDITELPEKDTIWHPLYGERSSVRDRYKAWSVTVAQPDSRDSLILEVRAYNEGIAFRYSFPGRRNVIITEEHTEYTLPAGTEGYFTPTAQTPYQRLPVEKLEGETERPLLLTLPGGVYVCLTEAQVFDYARTKFKLSSDKENTILSSMYGSVEMDMSSPVELTAPISTPWRVIMCGDKPGKILENNDIILNLNPPCTMEDVSWIRPGKAMREMTLSTEGGKALVDFAVKRNLQYIHFDAGWYGDEYDTRSDATTVTPDPKRNPQADALDLKNVVDYAKQNGIGVILYVNRRALEAQLDEILPLYSSWGIAGVKFGFVRVGSQEWAKWLHEAVRKCAAHHLMVDIHDEYRPTGVSRTYPNLMTQEGIRGNEEYPDATHNATLPFTRFVAGAADYTICYYKTPHTTPAHQLALTVVYYSPLQYVYWYDTPSDSQDEPELKFFDDVYTVWDDTKVLEGEVGEYIITARRKGSEWFVGAITNNDARTVSINLDFLPSGATYTAEIYADGDESLPTRTKVDVSKKMVSSQDVLRFTLKPSGGVALHLIAE